MNWFRKLIGLNGHEEIKAYKKALKTERDIDLQDLKNLNKKFRLTIDSGSIEVTIKNIEEIKKGK